MKQQNKRIKILHVGSYPSKYCGISDYTREFITALNKTGAIYNEYFTVFFYKKKIRTILDYILLSVKLLKGQYDYIHFQYTPVILGPYIPFFLWVYSKFLRSKSRIIMTAHEKLYGYLKHLPGFLHPIYKLYEKWSFELVDTLIVHTNEHKQILSQSYKLKNIFVVPHGAPSLPPNKEKEDEYRYRFGLNEYKFIIGFFGIIRPSKGVDLLVDAFINLASSIRDNSILLIAGSVPERYKDFKKQIMNKIKEAKVEKRVRFLGYIPKNEIRPFMKILDVLVLPYRDITQSGVLHIAISVNVPLILTNKGGFKIFVDKYKVAIKTKLDVNDLSKKIRYLLFDSSKVNEILFNQRKIKEMLSWDRIIEKYYLKEVYRNGEK